jgi:hypothetical protein
MSVEDAKYHQRLSSLRDSSSARELETMGGERDSHLAQGGTFSPTF